MLSKRASSGLKAVLFYVADNIYFSKQLDQVLAGPQVPSIQAAGRTVH